MKRRRYLKNALLVGAGAGIGAVGHAAARDPALTAAVTDPMGGDGSQATDTEIGTITFDSGPFDSLTLYDSGMADVRFNVGHEMDRFGVTHASLTVPDDPFQVWDCPRYEGPVAIPLRRVIDANGPHPSNDFTIGAYYESVEEFHFGVSSTDFELPESWYAAVQDD